MNELNLFKVVHVPYSMFISNAEIYETEKVGTSFWCLHQ